MRTDFGVDQADGLRRLLVANQTRAITLVSGKAGVGRTSVAINLAAALARSGKDVLVLDENDAPHNVADCLGLHAGHDLIDAVRGSGSLRESVLGASGFSVLSARRSGRQLNKSEQQRLESALAEMSVGMDVILVDAAMPAAHHYADSYGFSRGATLLVVVDATASGITKSYTLIKRLALENARAKFGIVVNKVVDERAAVTVFENMAELARRNFAASLEYMGCIPRDDRLKRAMHLGKAVVEAFPASESARSCVEIAHQLLRMPTGQEGAEDGVRTVIREMVQKALQPRQRYSRENAHVVN